MRARSASRLSDPTYRSWTTMKTRCTNSARDGWSGYGGRGITFCSAWERFEAFLSDMGPRPPGTTLDRIDNDGNYEPGNCRWATPKEQARNTRRTRKVFVDGEWLGFLAASEKFGLPYGAARDRIERSKNNADAIRRLKEPLVTKFTKDETGSRFGRLLVVERGNNDAANNARWLCRCDCGKMTTVSGLKLRSRNTKSCGCLRGRTDAA